MVGYAVVDNQNNYIPKLPLLYNYDSGHMTVLWATECALKLLNTIFILDP